MKIQRFELTAFRQNTRVVSCEKTGLAICIDPGEASEELTTYIADNGLTLQSIALTHGHLDHVGGTSALHRTFPEAEIIIHKADEPLYFALPRQPLLMGLQPHQLKSLGLEYEEPPKPTRNWIDGEIYELGTLRFEVLHCPGHTPGHVVLAERENKKVFVGDCLFESSIGRTDLPGGSYDQLIDSINRKILALGDDFKVYSGHGNETTVGREKSSNPFLNGTYQLGRGSFV